MSQAALPYYTSAKTGADGEVGKARVASMRCNFASNNEISSAEVTWDPGWRSGRGGEDKSFSLTFSGGEAAEAAAAAGLGWGCGTEFRRGAAASGEVEDISVVFWCFWGDEDMEAVEAFFCSWCWSIKSQALPRITMDANTLE